ncbi:palmitoyltransferase ZDHHC20-B-like [Paramacrobiotus metropolitanus]|uniref:palmitoyltransferase ZDHHC20-B-like n=1 Tax=Paramacrobiotus metropolitanus TaxID=2943436 RepID=UPI0024457591|nr:palmitoyltransferase ZDHHC20-B-like [Paramacrobiotus metropolitanus]
MFRHPCLRLCIAIAKWFPVVFISAVVGWAYYAYVYELCIQEIHSTTEKTFYLIFFHVFFFLFSWSYYQCIFTNGGHIPSRFYLSPTQMAELDSAQTARDHETVKKLLNSYATNLPVHTRGYNQDVRYCEKCFLIKPDRSHHCSVCERCILKMDHHWIRVMNSTGFDNYKFFVLFLGYAVCFCLYTALTDLPYFIRFWRDELTGSGNKFHILFLFFVSAMFMISLITLLSYHIYLTLVNRSTIESYRSPIFAGGIDKNGFHLGHYNNFTQIFGDNWLLWFIPVFTSKGNGLEYPVRSSRDSAYVSPAPDSTASQFPSHHVSLDVRNETTSAPVPPRFRSFQNANGHSNSNGHAYSVPNRHRADDQHTLLEAQRWRDVDAGETNLIALDAPSFPSNPPQQRQSYQRDQPRLVLVNE